jgi:hypothetical protein
MTPAAVDIAAPDPCPAKADIIPKILALLPRGRAWGTHDGGPWPTSTLYRFWAAIAEMLEFANARICALREEFFCATQHETRDRWDLDYGLPDPCDPFADLCVKVAAALGGNRTFGYFIAIAALGGFTITMARTGTSAITITVHTSGSISYTTGGGVTARAGRFRAGHAPGCAVNSYTPLICLIDRILPAHVAVTYVSTT